MSNFVRRASWFVALSLLLGATVSVVAQKQKDIPDLVSWWSGTTASQYDGDNDGFLINGATIVPGKISRGFHFDGVDDYVLVPPDPRLNVGAQGSLAFWMRSDPTNLMDTCCQGLVTTDYFGVSIASAPAGVVFYLRTAEGTGWVHTSDIGDCSQCAGGVPVSPGAWHHIVGTYNGTQLQLYIDGVAAGNTRFQTGTILPMLPGSFLSIGSEDGRRCCGGPRYFHGDIDEVTIYKRALTHVEVLDLFGRTK